MADEKEKDTAVVEEAVEETKAEPAKEEAPAKEEKVEEKKEEKVDEAEEVEVPAEFKDIIEKIEKMTVLELNALVKVFEKKFGVSAAAVAVAAPGAGEAAEEQTEFTVELTSDGGAKIPVMKVVKEVLGLGLKEAKDLVENLPATIKENIKKEEAEEIKGKIEEAGGSAELK
jgi:large subunit ribosomal protein L7/L12